MEILEIALMLLIPCVGTVLGTVILGLLADRFIIRKVMANRDIQDIIKLIQEGKSILKDLLENQNGKKP